MATKKKTPPPPTYSFSFAKEADPIALDARGLLPLADARVIVTSATAVTKNGVPPWRRLWAALLSLEDAAEFCREASRLEWQFPFVGGWDNQDAVLRFGAGVLPWLEVLLDRQVGVVGSIPALPFYFVGTHLLAIGPEAPNALAAVLRTRREEDVDAVPFTSDWLARHGQPAWLALAELALAGDVTARSVLDTLRTRSPGTVKKQLGKELAERLGGVPAALEAASILAILDAAASAPIGERLPWPAIVATAGHFEFHAMRVVAVRAKKGDDWGILVEVVQGDILPRGGTDDVEWPATVQHYTYGTKTTSGGAYLRDAHPIPASVAKENVDPARVAELDLRPGRSITGAIEEWPDVLRLRAAVATAGESLYTPLAKVPALLGLRAGEVLLEVHALEHVDGPANGSGDRARLPSASPSWRSIADVLVTRDKARFDAGSPNTDWRLLATRAQS